MAKTTDINGYWVYNEIPISRSCVAPYRGRQIDADGSMGLDPEKKYMVYRPASEVCNPRTIESFDGVPILIGHQMLGDGQRDVGSRRIDGTVYNCHCNPKDPGVLYASLKIMSKAIKNMIDGGMKALSCGYYCDYRPQKGVYKGQPYEFVQYDLTGNHLALVKKGRMGEKCAIMDSADEINGTKVSSAMDSADLTDLMTVMTKISLIGQKESLVRGRGRNYASDSAIDIQTQGTFMNTETNTDFDEMLAKALEGKGVKDPTSINKIIEFIGTLPAPTAEPTKDGADAPAAPAPEEPVAPAAAPAVAEQTPAPAAEPAPAPAGDDDNGGAGVDMNPCRAADAAPAVDPNAAPAPTAVSKEEFQAAVDAAVAEKYAKEDEGRQLAEDIAPKCGNLWKRGMDADDVAEAACEKLGHKDLPKEARIPFVKAMAAEAKKTPTGDKSTACDSAFDAPKGKSSTMLKYLSK